MLLHWCTLQPSGPSKLAAVRFSAPIHLQSIRIFPTDSQPFAHCPDVVASTKPNAFFLDVFFNIQAVQTDSKDKQRAPNALVPTVIAYPGGQMDFKVNMGFKHSTRLMIIKGDFESVSMAIYGETVSEAKLFIPPNELRQVTPVEPRPLCNAIDPSNTSDPTLLAQQLLALIPDAPPLPLVIRLMLCLKPSNDDWDDTEFPYIFADLAGCIEDFDLERARHTTSRPVADDISSDVLQIFSENVAAAIGPKSIEQSALVAEILSQIAPQSPHFSRIIMEHLSLELIFDAYSMDHSTIIHLLDACSNLDIARHFHADWFFTSLRTLQSLSKTDKEMELAVSRLSARIRGWKPLEGALSGESVDFKEAIDMMKDLGNEENALGIWLGTMASHQDILSKLTENPVPQCLPSLSGTGANVSRDEFIALVRAYIGVSCVLVIYAWSDSLPNARCRERTLGIIRLWQGVDGYQEIVNLLLQSRQMIFRLESLTEDHNPPSLSLIHVEHILVDLANIPNAILRPDLLNCVLSLRQPLSYITEDELLTMRRVASVAEQGLSAAIEEITSFTDHPIDIESLRILRVALAIVEVECKEAEYRVLQAFWNESGQGIISHLVDIFVVVAGALKEMSRFPFTPLSRIPQKMIAELYYTATDILRNIHALHLAFPLTHRSARILTIAIANVFARADAVNSTWSKSSPLSIAASSTRQLCLDFMRSLSSIEKSPEPSKPIAEIVLRTLLRHASKPNEYDLLHILRVYYLVDHLLPLQTTDGDRKSYWMTSVIPSMLPELKSFFRLLDAQNKAQFLKRLIEIDDGVVEIGEWILSSELRQISNLLHSLNNENDKRDRVFREHEVMLSLRFLSELTSPLCKPSCTSWLISAIQRHVEITQILAQILVCLLDIHMSSPSIPQITQHLASNCSAFDSHLRFVLAVTILRSTLDLKTLKSITDLTSISLHIFRDLPPDIIDMNRLTLEIGKTLTTIVSSESVLDTLDAETSECLLLLLQWVTELCLPDSTTLMISETSFTKLYDGMQRVLPSERMAYFDTLRSRIIFESKGSTVSSSTYLAENIRLSIQDLENILSPPLSMPSTPKRNTPDLLGLVTISPPTAILRSPAATGLTKTYSNNDFRQLRQLPSARQNTSRLPSMHVDDFESSPLLVPLSMPDVFIGLSPTFNTT